VLARTVARRAVVDARHALDADAWRACGWDYRAPGRPGSTPPARTAGIRLHQAEPHEATASFLAAAV
jgi:UDPglucose 6-dehydrogenase